jgi:hypothetical protein
MSSQTSKHQRLTNTFTVIANDAAYLLLQSDIDRWAEDYKEDVTVVGNVYTITSSKFVADIHALWNDDYYTLPDNGVIPLNVTLKDLGKDIYFGIPSQTSLLRGRLVELPGYVANSGEGGTVGFVWVESHAAELYDVANLYIGVART